MLLVITCWAHVEITVWMYPKCDWWIHWGKNDPEPRIYPRCSHWFLGHLTPSVSLVVRQDREPSTRNLPSLQRRPRWRRPCPPRPTPPGVLGTHKRPSASSSPPTTTERSVRQLPNSSLESLPLEKPTPAQFPDQRCSR